MQLLVEMDGFESAEGVVVVGATNFPDILDRALTRTMMGYWVNFARTGDPNGEALPQWDPYSEARGNYIDLGDRVEAKQGLRADFCSLLADANGAEE